MSSLLQSVFRDFFLVGPHAGAHRVALRAAASLAIPLLILYFMNRTDLALYASFGAFAAVYGRYERYDLRIFMQATAGITIVISMLIGTITAYMDLPAVIHVFVISIIATFVTLLAFRLGWRPTGAMFAVFAGGAAASIPATNVSFVYVIIVGGGTVLFTVLLTALLALRRVPKHHLHLIPTLVAWQPKFIINAAMIFVASLSAGWLGLALFSDHWYWAMVASIAVLVGPTIHARLTRGLQRALGTAVGVIFAGAIMAIDPPVIVVLLIAIFCHGFIEMIVLRNYAVAMIFITIIALVMVNLASPLPQQTLIGNRVLETFLGVAIGMILTAVVQIWDFEDVV